MGQRQSSSSSTSSISSIKQTHREQFIALQNKCDELTQRIADMGAHQPDQCKELKHEVETIQDLIQALPVKVRDRYRTIYDDYALKCEQLLTLIEGRERADRQHRQSIFNELMRCLEKVETLVVDVPCKPRKDDDLLYNSIEETLIEARGEIESVATFDYANLNEEKRAAMLYIDECLRILDELVFKRNTRTGEPLHEDNVYARILERKLKSAGFKRDVPACNNIVDTFSTEAIRLNNSGEIVSKEQQDGGAAEEEKRYHGSIISEGTAELNERRKDYNIIYGFRNKQNLKLPLM